MMKKVLLLIPMLMASMSFAQRFTDSLLLHIPTNANATDNSLKGYTATAAGVTYSTDYRGLANQALVGNGTSTRVTYNTASTSFEHAFPLTCGVWVNINSATGNYPIFYGADNYTKYGGIWLQVVDGYVYASVGDGAAAGTGNRYSVKSSIKFTIATWYNVCAVFTSANSIDLYINGTKDVSATASGGSTTMAWTGSNASYGSANTGAGTFSYFNGKLDNLMYWGRALSASEVKMYKDMVYLGEMGATVKDFGPTQTAATKVGTANDFDYQGKANGGLLFNGSSDKVTLPLNADYKPTAPFSISAWVYVSNPSGTLPIYASTDHTAGYYSGATLWIENGFPTMYIGDGTCNGATCRKTYISADSIKSGQWNMITAVVKDLNTIKIYINGVAVSGGSLSGQGTVMNNTPTIAGNIGYLTDAYSIKNKYFNGIIDEIMVMNTELVGADILPMYSKSVYVKTHPTGGTVSAGAAYSLVCKGIGTGPVTYQWQKMKWGTGWQNMGSNTQSTLNFPSLNALDTATYRCVVSSGGKSANSNLTSIALTPVNGVATYLNRTSIYPNPSSGVVHVGLPITGKVDLTVYNLNGTLMIKKVLNTIHSTIDISHLKSGVYIFNLADNSGLYQTKVVVSH